MKKFLTIAGAVYAAGGVWTYADYKKRFPGNPVPIHTVALWPFYLALRSL